MIPQHLGALHPWEQALTIVLAFGPFLLLGVVIVIQRRKDAREEAEEAERSGQAEQAEERTD
jgi:cytochrome c-type biogenesis protein CcmH/NrfF